MTFDALLVRGASLTLALVALWCVGLAICILVEASSNGRLRPARLLGCPPAWRRALVGAVVAVTAMLAPATAGATDATGSRLELDGLALPERTFGVCPSASTTASLSYRVRPGDSLWIIAVKQLGSTASGAEVAKYVTELHQLNSTIIGANPDVIHPGQQLLLPRSKEVIHDSDRSSSHC